MEKPNRTFIDIALVHINRSDITFEAIRMLPDRYDLYLLDTTGELSTFAYRRKRWITYIRGRNEGTSKNWNKVIRMTKAKNILLLSSDIYMDNLAIENRIEPVLKSGKANVYPLRTYSMRAWVISRETFDKIGGFDERFVCGGEDQDFLLRVSNEGMKIQIIDVGYSHAEGGHHTRFANPAEQIFKDKWGFGTRDKQYWDKIKTALI